MRWRILPLCVAAALPIGACAAQAADDVKQPASIWDQDTLTGDWGGARTKLKNDAGIEVGLTYVGEAFAVLGGGLAQRASYEGRLQFDLDIDLGTLIGWKGAKTHVTVFQIHNSGHTVADNTGSIFDPSNIDALATTRLFTAWFQQGDPDKDPFSLRVGQLAADDEFIISPTAGNLINGTFGWAGILAANMTSGGPAYPLATPGARVKFNPSENISVLAAVFSGDPAGANCNDIAQACNRYGTTFSTSGGSLWMGELQYKVSGKLPGVYKLGGWYATADFADQHFGINGGGAVVSLGVDPSATPIQHRGNGGVYGVADQTVATIGKDGAINLFARAGVSPSDRNLLNYYVDGGAGFTGLLATLSPDRAKDVLTVGVAYGGISPDAVASDRDMAAATPPYPIRNYELLFEVSYQAQIAPWWIVQPDLQYIVHPGGNVPDPNNPAATVANAFVAGIRSTIKF
jgi:porin